MTDPQLPTTKLQYYISFPQLYQSVRCKKKGLCVENIGEEQKKKICTSAGSGALKIRQRGGGHTRGSEGETSSGRRLRGGVAPSRQRIFAVSYKKNSHFSTIFIEKRLAMSAVTMDNAKIISHLMSKSRSLAKISVRTLQSLLVSEIVD